MFKPGEDIHVVNIHTLSDGEFDALLMSLSSHALIIHSSKFVCANTFDFSAVIKYQLHMYL